MLKSCAGHPILVENESMKGRPHLREHAQQSLYQMRHR